MITTDELKVQLAEHAKAVKDLEEALAIEASRKRVQELEHTMSRPGFYDDADLSKKVFDEVGDLKGKLSRFEKLQGLYDDAETMLEMLDEEYDPAMIPEAEEAVNTVGKAVEELQLMTMLNGEYDHSNAILTFHAGTGGTEAQDWAEMLYRMYNKWAQAHGMTVEVLDYQDGDEAGMKSASMMVKGPNAYGLLKSENGVHRLVRVSPFDANGRRHVAFSVLSKCQCDVVSLLHDTGEPSVTLCIPPTTTVSPALMPDLMNTRSGRRASTSIPRSAALPSSTTYTKFSSPSSMTDCGGTQGIEPCAATDNMSVAALSGTSRPSGFGCRT